MSRPGTRNIEGSSLETREIITDEKMDLHKKMKSIRNGK